MCKDGFSSTTTTTTKTETTTTTHQASSEEALTLPMRQEDESKPAAEIDDNDNNKSCLTRIRQFMVKNEFFLMVVVAILLARAYPPLGAEYLFPKITATWIAVIFQFVLVGLFLKTEEFRKAFQRLWFNLYVQVFNFGVVSSIVFGVSRLLVELGVLPSSLADGLVASTSVPMTVNMVFILTKTAGGDEAAAVFNAAAGNMVGVFLSPLLLLAYLGVRGDVDIGTVFYKLALRVLLPLAVGQAAQKTAPETLQRVVQQHGKLIKKFQQYSIIFIVYTVFCRTFQSDVSAGVRDIVLMIVFELVLLCSMMALAWFTLGLLFRDQPALRVMGLFGCTHKTVALGVPLIGAIYENSPDVGLYTLPLLIWHPMQLLLGSLLVPRLLEFGEREKERLGGTNNAGIDSSVEEQDASTSKEKEELPDADVCISEAEQQQKEVLNEEEEVA